MHRVCAATAIAWSLVLAAPAAADSGPESAPAPDVPSTETRSPEGWAVLPLASYAPETSLAAGGFGTHFFRVGRAPAEDSRPSSMSSVFLYTGKAQMISELIPELYWDRDRGHFWSRIDFRLYPNRVWDVGPGARDETEEDYTELRPRWQMRVGRAIHDRLFLYGHFEALYMKVRDAEPGGLLDRRALPGADGGDVVGLGPGLSWDTRDHLLVPRSGSFHELVVMLREPRIGSEYRYAEVTLNLRRYLAAFDTHVLALQGYAQLQWGEVPFFDMAQIGGDKLLRGYFEGRYRDKTLVAAQVEYRFPIVWRFGGVVHAAVGEVAPYLHELSFGDPEWSVGPGARLMLNRDERLNLRADLGVGPGTWGLYVSIAEAY